MISIKAVANLVGLSKMRIMAMCRDRTFPLPVKDRWGRIAWWRDEVIAWKEKAVARAS